MEKNSIVEGANGITQATLAYFLLLLWLFFRKYSKNIPRIFLNCFLEKSLNFFKKKIHAILLRFMLKIWQKMLFKKNSNPKTSPFIT